MTSSRWCGRLGEVETYLSDGSIMLRPTVSEDDLPLSTVTKPP